MGWQPLFRCECTDVADLDSVDKIVAIAPGAMTHHSDMSARYVELPSALAAGGNKVRQFSIPNTATSMPMPRGYYMVFALNTSGIPSIARWIKVQ